MATRGPSELTIRTYNVGFGDCFLLTFHYASRDRHVLIDFGSMSAPEGKSTGARYMDRVASRIAADCGGRLDAVVATHRHRDHISGFKMAKGAGPGAIIRNLKPAVVVQPWTEDPEAEEKADGPVARKLTALHLAALDDMGDVADMVVRGAAGLKGGQYKGLRQQLALVGMDNIKNPEAVDNLRTMAPNRYVHFGSNAGLSKLLPGVKVTVLGPPTVAQTRTILKQRSKDPDEFWHLNAGFWALNRSLSRRSAKAAKPGGLFPRHARKRLPWEGRWFRYYAMKERGESLLAIVRQLDDAMNNTSLILLFEINGKTLLFPGDAQYENWMYALSKPDVIEKLKGVNVYKVGHHGSLNATPRTLWGAFGNKNKKKSGPRLTTLLSTKHDVHGHAEKRTEVPRRTLVDALGTWSELVDTSAFAEGEMVHETRMSL